MQVSRDHHTQIPAKSVLRQIAPTDRRHPSRALPAERSRTAGRALHARPHPYVSERAAQVQHRAHDRGFLKGKSAVRIHRDLLRERRMTGMHFWASGYCVSTVGMDEARVRQYIRDQEKLQSGQGELDLK